VTVPLALDLALLPVALAGGGPALVKRLTLLDSERIPGLTVYSTDLDPGIAQMSGERLVPRLPSETEVAACRVLFVAGLPFIQSAELAAFARDHRVLVNVEDALPLCDFHVPAILRRGELAISISTGGSSPTAARRLCTWLSDLLPAEWAERLVQITTLRENMRSQGASMPEISKATDILIDGNGWLPPV